MFEHVLNLNPASFCFSPSTQVVQEPVQKLEQAGHRADIRSVSLSADDSLLFSASNTAVKVWNPQSGACLATMDSGYGLCSLFAPGNSHAVLGTKVRHSTS